MTKVKDEISTPTRQMSTSKREGQSGGGGSLSTPTMQGRDAPPPVSFNTSPPIFSMDALSDALGGFVDDDEETQFTFGLEKFEQKMCIEDMEQTADSVASALFTAVQSNAQMTLTNPSNPSAAFEHEQQQQGQRHLLSVEEELNQRQDPPPAIPSTSTSLPQLEHPLLESLYSPLTSPIYPRIVDNSEDKNNSSDSNRGTEAGSDSDFDVDGETTTTENTSDSDFNGDDSDSDYGGVRGRQGFGTGKRGRRWGIGNRFKLGTTRKQPYQHHKKVSKEKEGTDGSDKPAQPVRQINAHQLEAIAASMGSSPVTVNWLVQNYETSDGNSLPRALMYGHYLRHCAELRLDPVNAASFGKLIRSVFVGLTTRRLGTRGNSKYHYCGIRIKDTSTLLLEDPDLSKKTRSNGKRSKKIQILQMQGVGICGLGGNKGLTLEVDSKGKIEYKSVKKYLGCRSSTCTFPTLDLGASFSAELSTQDLMDFANQYKLYCLEIMEALELFKLHKVENVWKRFWQNNTWQQEGGSPSTRLNVGLSKERLMEISSNIDVRYAIQHWDAFTFDQILGILLPNVIAQVPFQLLEEYHKFYSKLREWLKEALESYDPTFIQLKMQVLDSFINELKSWISLCMSAQAARDSMQSPNSIAQLLSDLNRINFRSVLMDVKEYVNVDEMDINVHESLKRILSGPDSIEPWSVWLVGLVEQRLGMSAKIRTAPDVSSTANAVLKECQDLSLRWLKYMSQLKLELILRSSGSLATFLSLELLFSNFLLHLIKVYKSRAFETPLTLYSIKRKSQGIGRQDYPNLLPPRENPNPSEKKAESPVNHEATTDEEDSTHDHSVEVKVQVNEKVSVEYNEDTHPLPNSTTIKVEDHDQ